MFREIRTRERITEEDRKRKKREEELEMIRRVAGKHYSDAEVQAAKSFVDNLFMSANEETRLHDIAAERI